MNEVRMVAIDGATNITGCALFVNDELKDYGKIDLSGDNFPMDKRILEMGGRILKMLDIWKPSIIYIEEPQGHGKNIYVSGVIHEIIGFAKAWAFMHSAHIEVINPKVWRSQLKFRQGNKVKRKELKQQSMDAVLDIFGISVNDDIADAICLGIAQLQKDNNKRD